jgi:hypothetical protein
MEGIRQPGYFPKIYDANESQDQYYVRDVFLSSSILTQLITIDLFPSFHL